MTSFLNQALIALQKGDRNTALRHLQKALGENPHDISAWLCLADVVRSPEKQRECYRRILRIDPGNQAAQAALIYLDEFIAPSAPNAAAETASGAEMAADEETAVAQTQKIVLRSPVDPANATSPERTPGPSITETTQPISLRPRVEVDAASLQTGLPTGPIPEHAVEAPVDTHPEEIVFPWESEPSQPEAQPLPEEPAGVELPVEVEPENPPKEPEPGAWSFDQTENPPVEPEPEAWSIDQPVDSIPVGSERDYIFTEAEPPSEFQDFVWADPAPATGDAEQNSAQQAAAPFVLEVPGPLDPEETWQSFNAAPVEPAVEVAPEETSEEVPFKSSLKAYLDALDEEPAEPTLIEARFRPSPPAASPAAPQPVRPKSGRVVWVVSGVLVVLLAVVAVLVVLVIRSLNVPLGFLSSATGTVPTATVSSTESPSEPPQNQSSQPGQLPQGLTPGVWKIENMKTGQASGPVPIDRIELFSDGTFLFLGWGSYGLSDPKTLTGCGQYQGMENWNFCFSIQVNSVQGDTVLCDLNIDFPNHPDSSSKTVGKLTRIQADTHTANPANEVAGSWKVVGSQGIKASQIDFHPDLSTTYIDSSGSGVFGSYSFSLAADDVYTLQFSRLPNLWWRVHSLGGVLFLEGGNPDSGLMILERAAPATP